MKKLFSYVSFLMVIVALSFYACEDQSDLVTSSSVRSDGNLVVSFDKDRTESNVNGEELIDFTSQFIENRASRANKRLRGVQVLTANVERSGEYAYIIGKVKDKKTGRTSSIAIELAKGSDTKLNGSIQTFHLEGDGETGGGSAGTTHSCSGNPCSCCGFVKDRKGSITGCQCNCDANGHCDHTVTQN